MCSLLGFEQYFWTGSGLVIDIFGFGLISTDIFRQFRKLGSTPKPNAKEFETFIKDSAAAAKTIDDTNAKLETVERQMQAGKLMEVDRAAKNALRLTMSHTKILGQIVPLIFGTI